MEASKSEEKIYYVSSKSRITAILLCCLGFLGLGGFHRLYVKKWMTGLLYLMTFGLFFLGTAYDLHQLIVERFKDTDGFPLYSDGSMRQNYRRRRPKGRTPVGIKIVVPLALLAFALNLATMSQHEAAYQQQKAQQQAEQPRKRGKASGRCQNWNSWKISRRVIAMGITRRQAVRSMRCGRIIRIRRTSRCSKRIIPIFLPRCRWRKRKQKQSRNSSKRIFRRAQMRSTIRCRRFPCMPDMNRSGA